MQWLNEELERRLQTLFSTLIPGSQFRSALAGASPTAEDAWLWWQLPFDTAVDAILTVGLSTAAAREIGDAIRLGGFSGSTPGEQDELTVLRIVGNACASLASSPCGPGGTLEAPPSGFPSIFSLSLGRGSQHTVAVFLSPALVSALEAESRFRDEPEAPGPLDAMLNLDLPVSISMGKARVSIRDLLRLSTGSVVELDRALAEFVDVTVNDRVIARGEIVVVEGNYGVRIQTVAGAVCRSVANVPAGR